MLSQRTETITIRCTPSFKELLQIIRDKSPYYRGQSDSDIMHYALSKMIPDCVHADIDKLNEIREDLFNSTKSKKFNNH